MSKKNDEIESFNLMNLEVTELERRLELASNECSVASSASVKSCDGKMCIEFKDQVKT